MLGNYVAFSGAMRTMIENYVYFTLIKKYHKEEVWKDYFIWCLNIIYKKYPILAKNQALTDIANKMYEAYNLKPNSNTKPNGWLERVTNKKKITFKDACELIDNKVYEDYKSLSEYVHSTNYIFKN